MTIKRTDNKSAFHAGEIAIQQRIGVAESIAGIGQRLIRTVMPEQHRDFFTQQTFLIVGLLDQQGQPWVFPVFGTLGFIHSPDGQTLAITTPIVLADALGLDTRPNSKIGVLGIELATRRRNRLNGRLKSTNEQGLLIQVEQSFGNCPQYIQKRTLQHSLLSSSQQAFTHLHKHTQLSASAKVLIESADTFFIASRTEEMSTDTRTGIDASHRGGKSGFVRIDEHGVLSFPDFSGNRFYNTLGNIEVDGRVALFFPDFASGDMLLMTGRANIVWDDPQVKQIAGAERLINVQIETYVQLQPNAALVGALVEPSPVLDDTGTWDDVDELNSSPVALKPVVTESVRHPLYRDFKIVDKQVESSVITSFYLQAVDGQSLLDYIPGQFLPIKLNIATAENKADTTNVSLKDAQSSHASSPASALTKTSVTTQAMRSYTLSQAPNAQHYRLSIKREEQGVVSRYLHDHMQIGDVLAVAKPAGQFVLQSTAKPVVFLSAGVGITPMLAMLEGLVQHALAGVIPAHDVWLVHSAANSDSNAFAAQLQALARDHAWFHYQQCFSQPLPNDQKDIDYQHHERISLALLQGILPANHYAFYLCGPEDFMQQLNSDLPHIAAHWAAEWQTPLPDIYYESFVSGAAVNNSAQTAVDTVSESALLPQAELPQIARANVRFAQSAVQQTWTHDDGSLLELAEVAGLQPLYGCRSGNCGACAVALVSGEVSYPVQPSLAPEQGSVLLCCAQPVSDEVVLDV